jgi:hypothetical protein
MPRERVIVVFCFIAGLLLQGCSGTPTDPYEGATPLDPGPPLGKADSVGVKGLPASVTGGSTLVWKVVNQWEDRDTPQAREAGIAWPANSGLNWDEKFARWIESLKKINKHESTSSKTYEVSTPWGKTIPANKVDCADQWILLRPTFAAWYQLPFYMVGWDKGQRVYFGHFGIRTASGPWANMPYFANYKDHTHLAGSMSQEELLANWPRDEGLRKLGTIDKDDQPFISPTARTGAYLDEIHLNKRAARFIRVLMIYMGTPNLASGYNTFNLVPEALREGDALLYRRASNGSGHTLVVLQVGENSEGKITVEVASGNVPPRQPSWESEAASKNRFTNQEGGGLSTNSKGEVYAKIGGGLKRFRVAKIKSGYWVNTFMQGDEANWINDTDWQRIGERPDLFENLLGEVPPEEKRDAFLKMIEDARDHLRQYPASCAARERREDAFAELYDVMYSYHFGYMDKKEVDLLYRIKEDYVFAKLVYEKSKTCCWNSSTSHMFKIIMDYADSVEAQGGACAPPVVFKATNGGYDAFKAFAVSEGKGSQWINWSADESCPQAGVPNDIEAEQIWTGYCEWLSAKNASAGGDGGADGGSAPPSDGGPPIP